MMRRMLKSLASVFQTEEIIYIKYERILCVHMRHGALNCTSCIEACPAGAISPSGNEVKFDSRICAGCGGCASVCPTGAARFEPTSPRLGSVDHWYQRESGR